MMAPLVCKGKCDVSQAVSSLVFLLPRPIHIGRLLWTIRNSTACPPTPGLGTPAPRKAAARSLLGYRVETRNARRRDFRCAPWKFQGRDEGSECRQPLPHSSVRGLITGNYGSGPGIEREGEAAGTQPLTCRVTSPKPRPLALEDVSVKQKSKARPP